MRPAELLALDRRTLMTLLRAGHPIEPDALADSEYRGISLGLPQLIERLSWKKFQKVFHRDPSSGALRGWNVRLEQNDLDAPCVPLQRRGMAHTFGHFEVVDPRQTRGVPRGCDRGLLIDYGRGRNGRLNIISRLRDPIVALTAGSADVLLGWSYLDVLGDHVRTPSFFSLERVGPLREVVTPS